MNTDRNRKPPMIEPGPAYENAHLIARDLITRIASQLDLMPTPSSKQIDWQDLSVMNAINSQLSDISLRIAQSIDADASKEMDRVE